jgi:hypothetical protein
MDIPHYLHALLSIAAMVALVCRLAKMSKQTQPIVRWQHALLFTGLLWSLIVPTEYATLPVLLGVVAFLLLSSDRWRYGPPSGTTEPAPLDESKLHHVAGGRRHS